MGNSLENGAQGHKKMEITTHNKSEKNHDTPRPVKGNKNKCKKKKEPKSSNLQQASQRARMPPKKEGFEKKGSKSRLNMKKGRRVKGKQKVWGGERKNSWRKKTESPPQKGKKQTNESNTSKQ